MKKYKRYVEVIVSIDKYGNLTPLYILWEDGIKYKIHKFEIKGHRASVVGGSGILYVCCIQGQNRNLYYERNRFFIESYHP